MKKYIWGLLFTYKSVVYNCMPAELYESLFENISPPEYNYFNGISWVKSCFEKTVAVVSPIDGEILGNLQQVSLSEIDQVMNRAAAAQVSWQKTSLQKRIRVLRLCADWMRHDSEYLTSLLVREIGKTHEESKNEIQRSADLLDAYADQVSSLHGESIDSDQFPGFERGAYATIGRVAYGVVVAIGPFNYPINLSISKIAPALLMGNSVVFKPPTQGSISALHMSQLFIKAGIPEGVFSVITGSGSAIGDQLISHKQVRMIMFTGSSQIGISIASKARMVPLLFECGGNNPVIVLPDADTIKTAREIVSGGFSFAGQRCTGIKYVLATQAKLQEVLDEVKRQMAQLVKVGDPRNPETKLVGPVISKKAADEVMDYITEAVSLGAIIETGGTRSENFIQPTVLSNVTPQMRVIKEEVFGPVISFVAVTSTREALEIINNSRYALQASIFTSDEGAGILLAEDINTGSVQINGSPKRGPDNFPFLGVKDSGVGVQGVRYALEACSRLKPVILNKPS